MFSLAVNSALVSRSMIVGLDVMFMVVIFCSGFEGLDMLFVVFDNATRASFISLRSA